jgi:predicted MFS family arabinose efflux permease
MPDAPARRPPLPGRWAGVLVLTLVVGIAYMDRINVALLIADDGFLHAFGLAGDRVAQGRLMTLFLLGYGVSAWLLTPLLEARWDVRRALLASLLAWAALTGASALAGGAAVLLLWRCLLGVAEGPLFSLKTMYVQARFAADEVGKPNAVSSLGVSLGLGVGYPVVGLLLARFGWQGAFGGLAALNLLLGVPLVLALVRARPAGTVGRPARALLRAALGTRHLPWLLVIEICTLSYLWGASTWLPSWLKATHHLAPEATAALSGLPFVIGIVATLAGGALVDALPAPFTPFVFVAGGLATAASVTLAITAAHPSVAVAALLAAGAFWGVQGPAIPTLVQRFAAPGTVGSVYGVVNGVGNLAAAFMPMLMGAAMSARGGERIGQGFWLLVGSQGLTALGGAMLMVATLQARRLREAG